jgi:PAS domain S-box-containing protein
MEASGRRNPDDRKLLDLVGAAALIVVPIATDERTWGLLLVFLQYRSLFIEDDLSLVELLAQESTILLDNYRLIGELQAYSEQLERKVEERTLALRQSEKLYRTIARNFPNGSIVLFDTDLRYIVADGTELGPLGLSSEQLEGKTIWEVHPQAYCDEVLEPAYRSILAGNLSPTEIPYEDRVRLLVGVPVRDENNRTFAGVLITQDITERRRAEDEVRRLNTELEQRVVERTAELEAVNRELEAFSYSVSHDLRSPLRTVDGFSQALLEDYNASLDDSGRDFLHRIRSACQRMGQLIDDMIELSRVTRTEMNLAEVDLSEIVREIAADLEADDPGRAVEFSIQSGLKGRGDARLLRVALQNLIGNAWKFTMKKPQARIEFGRTNGADAAEYYVRVNGAGFDMVYVDKLFGAFQRLHAMDEFSGTGIGLATVQRVIRRHSGAIRAEAAVNEGATFYFTLGGGNYA